MIILYLVFLVELQILKYKYKLVRNTPVGLNVFTKFHPATTNKLQEKHLKYCPANFRSKFCINKIVSTFTSLFFLQKKPLPLPEWRFI